MEWNPTLETASEAVALRATGDRVIGKSRGELFAIECDVGTLETILAALRTRTTLAELANKLDAPRGHLEPFVRALVSANLVSVVDGHSHARTPYVQSVLIAGAGLLTVELVRLLELAGLEAPVSARESWPGVEVALRASPLPLLVGAPAGASVSDLRDVNDACLRTDTPWLPLYFDGAAVRLGPTILPFRTPCFGCLLERLALDHEVLYPHLPPRAAFSLLQDTWPFPDSGCRAVNALRALPYCVEEILTLAGFGPFPRLIGRQLIFETGDACPPDVSSITFEANSRCPACFCGDRSRPLQARSEPLTPPPAIRLESTPVLSTDGGLRTVSIADARRLIDRSFAPFGDTIRVERCNYGPLAHLPSYRSFSSGYVDRRLPFALPPKQHTGKGVSEEQAYLSAAFEMAERISAIFHGQSQIVQARPSEVRPHAIDLGACLGRLCLAAGGYDRVEEDPVVDWVWAESLITGKPRLVPASMAFFPQVRFRGLFKPQWSGGLSAGATMPDAVLQGLLERVEHDGWAVWQLNRIACPRVDERTIPDAEILDWLEIVKRAGFELIIRDRRTELGIPSFRVWLVLRDKPPAYGCRGDGAHLDKRIALKRALTEAQHKLAFTTPGVWEQVLLCPTSQLLNEERSLYYLAGLAPFELSEEGPRMDFREIGSASAGDVARDIATVVGRIAREIPDSDVLVVNLTSPYLGIPAVRVFTTGLQEMAKPWLYVLPRTFELPVRLGRRGRALEYEEMYGGAFPH